MGRLPIRSLSFNIYFMLSYHCGWNIIIVETLGSKHNHHHLSTYNNIRRHIKLRSHKFNIYILDDEASAEYCRTIKK